MKRLVLWAAALLLVSGQLALGASRDAQWAKVREAVNKGLPQTAITNLEPIIAAAMREKAYPEAVKAIGEKIVLEGNIQGNKPEERITRLETEIGKAPPEMVPVIHTLLAHWYWSYFQQNRWRFMQRTTTAQNPGKDFTTWDLPRIFAQIDSEFQSGLSARSQLKAVPIESWGELLEKGTMPDSYRPTLFDFVAHEALEFYTAGEQAGARPEGAFDIEANGLVLGPAEEFLQWKVEAALPPAQQREKPLVPVEIRAIALFQELMDFHRARSQALAFAAVDLERVAWGWNVALGEEKNARYQSALEDLIRRDEKLEVVSLAYEHEARLMQQEQDFVRARKLALRGAELFPDSPGGKLCRNVVSEIEQKSATINTERVWNAPWPEITVHYRNVTNVYFRAVPYDWEQLIQKRYYSGAQNLSEAERRELIRMKPSLEWSQTLPPTTDYKEKDFRIRAPEKLKAGFYFIIASHDPGFGESENIVSVADVWVSELALITRERAGNLEGFVLEANSGEPLSGVDVDIWHMDNQGRRVRDPKLMTDTNGFFSSKAQQNYGYLVRARQGQREIASGNDISVWNYQNAEAERARAQTVFFTDRALYRPGQTIQYKGICLWVDQSKDNCEVLKGEELTVLFKDMNGKEVARQKHRANDYGSFAGSFTAPRDRVTGNMYLEVSGRAQGQANFRVEEYKRPKFEVTLDPPKRAAKLNEKVSLEGRATSYTGAAVDEAAIRYRVIRQVRMPWWWGWYGRGRQGGESQEIAHGTTTTKTDGSFSIDFVAKPDLKVPEKDEPTFVFEVHADVTDSAGETRSADHSIRAGYTALEVTMGANDWETPREPVRIKVETRSLDGEPQEAHGTIKLYRLKQPETVQRASLEPQYRRFPNDESDRPDLSDPNKWDLGEVADEQTFTTGTNGLATNSFQLAAGVYRALLETRDRFGKKVSGKLPLKVLDPDANTFTVKIPHLLAAPEWELQPGDDFMALWGTGYEEGRAFIEFEHRHQIINRFWTQPGHTQQQLKLAVTEAMRGGFTLHVTQVRENRAYLDSRKISVPWKNKALALKWEHFVSKLQPGQKETWTAVVSGPSEPGASAESERKGGTHGLVTSSPTKAVAEMVATLYDESLDAFAPHRWTERFNVFREDNSYAQTQFGNSWQQFQHIFGNWGRSYEQVTISYRSFPPDFKQTYYWNHGYFGGAVRRGFAMEAETAMPAAQAMSGRLAVNGLADNLSLDKASAAKSDFGLAQDRGEALKSLKEPPGTVSPDLNKVSARKNLNETAFFYPQLTSDSNGVVRMTFTMPEALTRWRFMGFASDQTVRSGYLEDHAVTAKDLMVQPNPPRFLREGDTLEFTVKVSNQSEKPQSGTVRLTFNLALKDESADALLGNTKPEQAFEIPAKESRGFSWRIHVPDACGFLTYKAVAASATVSDGEEGAVPVLSRRILVTETLPLPIRGPATKKFEFAKLVKSGSSKTLENESLTVQMVSNPAWYAVLALPYLMEYPYECSEQVFNRLYANALARNIANSDAKIHRIFEQWRNTPALESPLEKNQDLKAVSLEETPWLRQAESESQARRNVGVLFDDNRLNYETQKTMEKLTQMQLPDGSWPWFPGGQRNEFITLYIVTGFGRLRHLGVEVDVAPAVRSLQGLDAWMTEHYQNIMRGGDPDKYVPSATDALYLYGRSFFLKDMPIGSGNLTAIDFFLKQSRKFWLKTENRQSQGHLAIALSRFNTFNHFNDTTPIDIMKSIKERSVSAEEMGMFWRDTEYSWYWFRAPLETQALMIEAFDEIMQDANTVEECKVWLLKQKQTQDWKTTKATADAVYALLLRGKNVLASDALVEVSVGGKSLTPQLGASSGPQKPNPGKTSAVEPGTGFYEVRFTGPEIKPKLGEITVKKVDEGVAWGSMHWQYLEDISKITPHEGTPLKLKKTLFTKVNSTRGPVLEAVRGPLKVGDELVVRIELRTDRDMEYVHLKDQRGSGLEPLNVLSQYRYQDGLAYYESTRDTASHFFIDYLPKGTYVFEYSTRVVHRGEYQSGMAEIQCMYAPEFNSHSESLALIVR